MKKLLVLLLVVTSTAFSAEISIGDSITTGVAATTGNAYITWLSAALATPITNYAVSGDQAADQSIRTYGATLSSSDRATIMIGTNDQWKYGTSTYKQLLYQSFLTGIIANLSIPNKVTVNSAGMVLTGTWTASQPTWSRGKWSSIAGSTASATVSGTAIYVGVIRQDDLSGNPINGTANVSVDGVLVGSIGSAATGMTTQNGNTYAPAAYRFGGLSAGVHTVQITITSTYADYRGIMYLEYIAGSSQSTTPNIYTSTIPRYSAAGYASVGGSDANMAIYNSIVRSVVADAVTDGLSVYQVDASAKVNPATDLNTDGVHPLNQGHAKIYSSFYSAITGIPFP